MSAEEIRVLACFSRNINSRWQEWNLHVQNSDRFNVYRSVLHRPRSERSFEAEYRSAFEIDNDEVFTIKTLLYIITEIKGILIMNLFVH